MNYAAQQAPLQGMANQMAQYGRYGDSMLVHMNPIEVQGIAALSPTGQLTTNPVTGQPEAFLPFLAPILGTMLGKAFLPALATKMGIAGLGANVAGAIGSGLATTAVTGDIKEGILSGITGYGLGQMLGGATDALNPQIAKDTADLATVSERLGDVGKDVLSAKTNVASAAAALPGGQGVTDPSLLDPLRKAALDQSSLLKQQGALTQGIDAARAAVTPTDIFTAPLREPVAFAKGVLDPKAILPIAIGEGTRGQYQMQERLEEDRRRLMGEGQEDEGRAIYNMQEALAQLERDYGPMRLAAGGITSINPDNYRQNMEGLHRLAGQPIPMQAGGFLGGSAAGSTGAGARQASIRPPSVTAPPEGYRPGFDPEFVYFQTKRLGCLLRIGDKSTQT
jgi:hypothetical protein